MEPCPSRASAPRAARRSRRRRRSPARRAAPSTGGTRSRARTRSSPAATGGSCSRVARTRRGATCGARRVDSATSRRIRGKRRCETLEETGILIRVGAILGIWVQAYADDPRDDECDWISVAYYAADAVAEEGEADPAEVSEQRWFDPEALPPALAPPNTLTAVLEVWEATRVRTR